MRLRLVLVLTLLAAVAAHAQDASRRPRDIVDAASVVPGLAVDMRYTGERNFLGRPVPGYVAPKCLLTRRAAAALARVQAELRPKGLGLKVYDCYRPQRAVDAFVAWARDAGDARMKADFYPDVAKSRLFAEGYIARRSGHSRASTVDVTIVPLDPALAPTVTDAQPIRACATQSGERAPDASLDMGSGFDCFGPVSHTASARVKGEARRNRELLRSAMERQGFQNLPEEWWHYTLAAEPYPDTYFDFPVQ